ncbi:chromatin assembly subunit-like protein [Grosmannia clavigera kw1407]|uniref:Chromatin assembly subunit-like protein n=1 Tax=Grosmannia clavigera (strain kw1407 / UAMH 11150) TaxID=655863 RepID=F0XNZ6_GROCL|nr:chromatin assembly subunit-like protein [Grosmannia clavigera kw1407]EFX00565.1 chromatin assembly subunit-like protein [Grosmannia clavigera kw1407]
MAKTELPLNYDYDSEAEWVDDGDGEDVDDLDDEEEEVEEDEEMSDFLDDSEDAVPLRAAFSGGMEPESTGLCWENQLRQAPLPIMDAYRMEFIMEALKPGGTGGAAKTPKPMAPPPVPTDALAALGASTAAQGGIGSNGANNILGAVGKADPKKAVVAAEFVGDFKKAIMQYSKLSKLGIVEILSAEFERCTKSQIKNSLEALAERTGSGQHKTWKLKDGVSLRERV